MSERGVVHILLSPAYGVSSPLFVPSFHVQFLSPVLELHVHAGDFQRQTSLPHVGERTSLPSQNLYIHCLSYVLVMEWEYRRDRPRLEHCVELSGCGELNGCDELGGRGGSNGCDGSSGCDGCEREGMGRDQNQGAEGYWVKKDAIFRGYVRTMGLLDRMSANPQTDLKLRSPSNASYRPIPSSQPLLAHDDRSHPSTRLHRPPLLQSLLASV